MMPAHFNRHGKARVSVLIIDDSPAMLALLEGLLKFDYQIMAAHDGESGLQLAAALAQPDLILLDVVMPGLDGHEVCRRLKADPATRDIPVIFLTSMNHEADVQLGFELGKVVKLEGPGPGGWRLPEFRPHALQQLQRQRSLQVQVRLGLGERLDERLQGS